MLIFYRLSLLRVALVYFYDGIKSVSDPFTGLALEPVTLIQLMSNTHTDPQMHIVSYCKCAHSLKYTQSEEQRDWDPVGLVMKYIYASLDRTAC